MPPMRSRPRLPRPPTPTTTRDLPRQWSGSCSGRRNNNAMGKAIGRVEILPDPLALARHVAEWMTAAALAAEGDFRVSLSGGSTPKTLYGLLASDEFLGRFPWSRVSWYWGD